MFPVLDVLNFLIYGIFSLYLCRTELLQKESAKESLRVFEAKFSELIVSLAKKNALQGVQYIRNFAGIAALILLAVTLLVSIFFPGVYSFPIAALYFRYVVVSFVMAALIFMSVTWFSNRNYLWYLKLGVTTGIGIPISTVLLGLILKLGGAGADSLSGLTPLLWEMFYQMAGLYSFFGIAVPIPKTIFLLSAFVGLEFFFFCVIITIFGFIVLGIPFLATVVLCSLFLKIFKIFDAQFSNKAAGAIVAIGWSWVLVIYPALSRLFFN